MAEFLRCRRCDAILRYDGQAANPTAKCSVDPRWPCEADPELRRARFTQLWKEAMANAGPWCYPITEKDEGQRLRTGIDEVDALLDRGVKKTTLLGRKP